MAKGSMMASHVDRVKCKARKENILILNCPDLKFHTSVFKVTIVIYVCKPYVTDDNLKKGYRISYT